MGTGRLLNEPLRRKRNATGRMVLFDDHSTSDASNLFEVTDTPLVLQLFGATGSQTVTIYSYVRGLEAPFLLDGIPLELNQSVNSVILETAGVYRARVTVGGRLGLVCTAHKQTVEENPLEIPQASGVQANLPNLFMSPDGAINPTHPWEIHDKPWVFTAFGLEAGEYIEVYVVYGHNTEYVEQPYLLNGVAAVLTPTITSIVLSKAGRYRFKLVGSVVGKTLVGNPTATHSRSSGDASSGVVSVLAGIGIAVSNVDPTKPVVALNGNSLLSLSLADSSLQPGDNISELTNNVGYLLPGAPVSVLANDANYLAAGANISLLTNNVGYTVPGTNISVFTNDAGYITAGTPISTFPNDANYLSVGDNVSQLSNDAGYVVPGAPISIFVNDEAYLASGANISELTNDVGYSIISSTDDVPEGLSNLYYSDARARTAVLATNIIDGDLTHAPDGNAVFDALALKVPTSRTVTAGAGLAGGGPLSGNITLSMANTTVFAATYGSATQSVIITVNSRGQITNAFATAITPAWLNITDKPTTLAGYGITDAAADSSVVHKTGGLAETITGVKTFTDDVEVKKVGTTTALRIETDIGQIGDVQFHASDVQRWALRKTNSEGFQLKRFNTSGSLIDNTFSVDDVTGAWTFAASAAPLVGANVMWHAGNDGAGSGLDADLLDGLHASSFALGSNFADGTYTPTLSNITNITGSTVYIAQYMRVGNTVTVSGKVDIDPTTTATSIELRMSLPIVGGNFTNDSQAGGSAVNSAGKSIRILAQNGGTLVRFVSSTDIDDLNRGWHFSFTYRIQ